MSDAAAARPPESRFRRPAGKPDSRARASTRRARRVPAGEGFQTTALPSASAGAIFPIGIATGLFHGVIAATTPSATRRQPEGVPPASSDAGAPRRISAARRTSARPSATGFPTSVASSCANASASRSSASAKRRSRDETFCRRGPGPERLRVRGRHPRPPMPPPAAPRRRRRALLGGRGAIGRRRRAARRLPRPRSRRRAGPRDRPRPAALPPAAARARSPGRTRPRGPRGSAASPRRARDRRFPPHPRRPRPRARARRRRGPWPARTRAGGCRPRAACRPAPT